MFRGLEKRVQGCSSKIGYRVSKGCIAHGGQIVDGIEVSIKKKFIISQCVTSTALMIDVKSMMFLMNLRFEEVFS